MTGFVHIGRAADGRWVKGFSNIAKGAQSLRIAAYDAGREVETGRTYYGSDGSTHRLEALPPGMKAVTYGKLLDAFDARECGTETKDQKKLLARWGW